MKRSPKIHLKDPFLLLALMAGLGSQLPRQLSAQTFTTLHNFTGGSDGGVPNGLILSDTTHSFTVRDPNAGINRDGAGPSGLALSGSTLYGTAGGGGSSGNGTVVTVNTDGTGFRVLHSFTALDPNTGTNADGAIPFAPFLVSANTLYGTAGNGGSSNHGTIFSISLPVSPPQLTIAASGGNVILNWPTNASGFILQSTANLGPSAVWTTNSPAPVNVNGQNTVTNPISGTQQFFRLVQ